MAIASSVDTFLSAAVKRQRAHCKRGEGRGAREKTGTQHWLSKAADLMDRKPRKRVKALDIFEGKLVLFDPKSGGGGGADFQLDGFRRGESLRGVRSSLSLRLSTPLGMRRDQTRLMLHLQFKYLFSSPQAQPPLFSRKGQRTRFRRRRSRRRRRCCCFLSRRRRGVRRKKVHLLASSSLARSL